jgi:FtsH-binding integral membrane protein
MTRRTYRLLAPGVVFTAIGVLVLWLAPSSTFQLRGGLTMAGVFALVLQVVGSLFVITSIDDLGEHRRDNGRRSRALTGQRDASLQRVAFPQAVAQFYLQSAVAMTLLSFGLAVSLTAIVDGTLTNQDFTDSGSHPSEVVLAVLLVAGAVFLAVAGTRAGYLGGYFGWCIGFALGAGIAESRFLESDDGSTVSTLTALAVLLSAARLVLWAIVKGIGWWRARSRPALVAG